MGLATEISSPGGGSTVVREPALMRVRSAPDFSSSHVLEDLLCTSRKTQN